MTGKADTPNAARKHYPSRYLLNVGFGLLGVAILAQAAKLFGASLLSAPLAASLWLGGFGLALVMIGLVWQARA